jgi:VanZ family protein
LIEYSLVAILIHMALIERENNDRWVPLPGVLAILMTAFLGLLDEGIQYMLPTRVFDLRDVSFNSFAGLLAVGARSLIIGLRKKKEDIS